MSRSEMTVRLEYIVEGKGREPYEQVKELPITEYNVGEDVPGKPILGLQVKEDDESGRRTYRLYRVSEALPIDLVDGSETSPRVILFKIRWHSFRDPNDGVTAAYEITGRENLSESIVEERDDIDWKYILKEENDRYHLVRIRPKVAGNVTLCEVLENQGINCSKSRLNPIEETECRTAGCIPRPKRPWWQRIVRR